MTPLDTWAAAVPIQRRYTIKWLSAAQCCVELWSGRDCVAVGFGRTSESAATDALSYRGQLQAKEIHKYDCRKAKFL